MICFGREATKQVLYEQYCVLVYYEPVRLSSCRLQVCYLYNVWLVYRCSGCGVVMLSITLCCCSGWRWLLWNKVSQIRMLHITSCFISASAAAVMWINVQLIMAVVTSQHLVELHASTTRLNWHSLSYLFTGEQLVYWHKFSHTAP